MPGIVKSRSRSRSSVGGVKSTLKGLKPRSANYGWNIGKVVPNKADRNCTAIFNAINKNSKRSRSQSKPRAPPPKERMVGKKRARSTANGRMTFEVKAPIKPKAKPKAGHVDPNAPPPVSVEEMVVSQLHTCLKKMGIVPLTQFGKRKFVSKGGRVVAESTIKRVYKGADGFIKLIRGYPSRFTIKSGGVWLEPADQPFKTHNPDAKPCKNFQARGFCMFGADCKERHSLPDCPIKFPSVDLKTPAKNRENMEVPMEVTTPTPAPAHADESMEVDEPAPKKKKKPEGKAAPAPTAVRPPKKAAPSGPGARRGRSPTRR